MHRYKDVILQTLFLILVLKGVAVQSKGSLTDRLLALWTNGEIDSDVNGGHVESSETDDSLKKVLTFLSEKAATSENKKVPNAALAGLNALITGSAKTPKPINLQTQNPAQAVLVHFQQLGIDDKECRKRTICELLTEPQAGYGVFGELLNYVFGKEKPDSEVSRILGEEYHEFYEAAQNGRRIQECDQLYGVCKNSYKEYIKLTNV